MARCNSCPAEVLWLAHITTGKTAPIDAEPAEGGNIEVSPATGKYRIVPADERPALAGLLHTNHFVTCPEGPAWKGRHRG